MSETKTGLPPRASSPDCSGSDGGALINLGSPTYPVSTPGSSPSRPDLNLRYLSTPCLPGALLGVTPNTQVPTTLAPLATPPTP